MDPTVGEEFKRLLDFAPQVQTMTIADYAAIAAEARAASIPEDPLPSAGLLHAPKPMVLFPLQSTLASITVTVSEELPSALNSIYNSSPSDAAVENSDTTRTVVPLHALELGAKIGNEHDNARTSRWVRAFKQVQTTADDAVVAAAVEGLLPVTHGPALQQELPQHLIIS